MSGLLQGLVFKHANVGQSTLLVFLAMADIADDDGTKIFPSVKKLAIKTRSSERNVKRCIKELEDTRRIKRVAEANGRTGIYAEWEIDVAALLSEPPLWTEQERRRKPGAKLSPGLSTARGHLRHDQVPNGARPGDKSSTRIEKKRPLNVLDTSAGSPRAPQRRGDPSLWNTLAEKVPQQVLIKLVAWEAEPSMQDERLVVDFARAFAERHVRAERAKVQAAFGRETVFRYAGREGQP